MAWMSCNKQQYQELLKQMHQYCGNELTFTNISSTGCSKVGVYSFHKKHLLKCVAKYTHTEYYYNDEYCGV